MNIQSRRKKLLLNTVWSVLSHIITIICGFVIPRAIILNYGSNVNGLLASITHFLAFITFLECGISSVIQANMYEPLEKKDYKKLSEVFVSSRNFFNKIGTILVFYVIILSAIYPFFIRSDFSFLYTFSLIIILSISFFAQYYLGLSYRIVLNADQYSFIAQIFQCISLVINLAAVLYLINNNYSIQMVKLLSSIIFLFQPFAMKIYVDKKYNIDNKIKVVGEPIKQKWNGLAQHIAFIVNQQTDVVILTLFSTLNNVSVYHIYHLILSGITGFLNSVTLGISPLIGNMIVKKENELLLSFIYKLDWLIHFIVVILFSSTWFLIKPFIKIYTNGVTDADYINYSFATVFIIAQSLVVLRIPYATLVNAAGHFKETQTSSVIEVSINIIFSIICVRNYGLLGVAIGTLLAMLYRYIYLANYISKNLIDYDLKFLIKLIMIDIFSLFIIINYLPQGTANNTYEWLRLAVIEVFYIASICSIINAVAFPKTISKFLLKKIQPKEQQQ